MLFYSFILSWRISLRCSTVFVIRAHDVLWCATVSPGYNHCRQHHWKVWAWCASVTIKSLEIRISLNVCGYWIHPLIGRWIHLDLQEQFQCFMAKLFPSDDTGGELYKTHCFKISFRCSFLRSGEYNSRYFPAHQTNKWACVPCIEASAQAYPFIFFWFFFIHHLFVFTQQ